MGFILIAKVLIANALIPSRLIPNVLVLSLSKDDGGDDPQYFRRARAPERLGPKHT